MDMDDDFIGETEFKLSAEQGELVNRAIMLASNPPDDGETDEFTRLHPLIAIMRWWQTHVPEHERLHSSPEATLVDACRRFVLAREARQT
jgi:hypothetical protein